VSLTVEQRTRIQQTVLAGSNVPRVNNVNFALSVGTNVPTNVRVVEVPGTLIEIHPEWRGHRYFVVRDEIVIVDTGHRIVATLPMGSSSSGAQLDTNQNAQLGNESGGMSSEEIRQVQIVLNEKGFDIGEPDGVLNSRTRQALITFQQRQGLQASGRIDVQTTTALGISGKGGEQGNRGANSQPSSTTGQGGGQPQPSANQGQPSADQGGQSGNQPATSGQGGNKMQPPANQDVGNAQPSNQGQSPATGQGGNATQSPSPNMNQNNMNHSAPRSGGQAK
jgi:peptidoglycan hydrolase-like protein with peptidoglycan-binding domain